MALPNKKESFKNLFPDIVVDDVKIVDFWRAWQITEEFRLKVKIYGTYFITNGDRWDTVAESIYNDRSLWWLLVMFNDIEDPFSIYFEDSIPESIRSIKVIREEDVGIILNAIRNERLKFEKEGTDA